MKMTKRVKVSSAIKAANDSLVENAKNPCKAAWKTINGHRVKQACSSCVSSPDEINVYFIDMVGGCGKQPIK